MEAIRHFSDPDVCLKFMAGIRWPDGKISCPRCNCDRVGFIKTRRTWQCKGCSKQFSVKVGTIFEDSPLGLDRWLVAIWMIANCKNGISSYEIHRSIGVTQKTAWFMLHRIRLALQNGSVMKHDMKGEIEADETWIGGKSRNMHKDKRKKKITGRGGSGKAIVMGVLQRGGEVRAKVVPNNRKATVQAEIQNHVYHGSEVFTDALKSYRGLEVDYIHEVIDHAVCYVRGKVHTNSMENFWSLLKRCLGGTYVSVREWHLFRYLDEQSFRFNTRTVDDLARFLKALASISGKRLTHKQLTGKTTT